MLGDGIHYVITARPLLNLRGPRLYSSALLECIQIFSFGARTHTLLAHAAAGRARQAGETSFNTTDRNVIAIATRVDGGGGGSLSPPRLDRRSPAAF